MTSCFRFGGLVLALALLLSPAWLLDRYVTPAGNERSALIRAFRVHGLGLGQSADEVARRYPEMRIAMIPGTLGVAPRLNGYLFHEGEIRGERFVGRRNFTIAFTGPRQGFRMYSLIVNESAVAGARVAAAVLAARRALGRERQFEVFTDRRRFMIRHVRAYRWGVRGQITYSLYVERIDPADGEAVLYLMHILNDATLIDGASALSPGPAGDAQPMDRESSRDR